MREKLLKIAAALMDCVSSRKLMLTGQYINDIAEHGERSEVDALMAILKENLRD